LKKAFTLLEFILVITVIGVLLAFALMAFEKTLKGSGSFANLSFNVALQLARNAYNLVPATYLNHVDLNGNSSATRLKELITIRGKDWSLSEDGNTISYSDATIESGEKKVIELELLSDRRVVLRVFCDKYSEKKIRDECKTLAPNRVETKLF